MSLFNRVRFIEDEGELTFLDLKLRDSQEFISGLGFDKFIAETACDTRAHWLAMIEGYDIVHKKDKTPLGSYTVAVRYDFYNLNRENKAA